MNRITSIVLRGHSLKGIFRLVYDISNSMEKLKLKKKKLILSMSKAHITMKMHALSTPVLLNINQGENLL